MNPRFTANLAVAHGTMACLAGFVAVAVAVVWPGFGRLSPDESLHTPATAVLLAAIVYLAATFWTELRWARRLRASSQTQPASLWPLMGHVWVLMVVGASVARGPASRAHLAGFDRTLAALATISLLCVVVLLVTWCCQLGGQRAAPLVSGAAVEGDERRCAWLQLAAAVLLVLSLWWLESRPWQTRGADRGRASNAAADLARS